MNWYLLVVFLLLLFAVSILWAWRRAGRLLGAPLPHPFRNRQSQESAWKHISQNGTIDKADACLRSLCEAFGFNPDDRYRFAPSDRIRDVYRACYPRWKFWNPGDNLEIESFLCELNKRFAVKAESWRSDITLAEIVELMKPPCEDRPAPGCER